MFLDSEDTLYIPLARLADLNGALEANGLDAAKLELPRIGLVGLAGFDKASRDLKFLSSHARRGCSEMTSWNTSASGVTQQQMSRGIGTRACLLIADALVDDHGCE